MIGRADPRRILRRAAISGALALPAGCHTFPAVTPIEVPAAAQADYREALALADTVVVLNKGKVEQIGPPDEVFSRPRNVFVATLLGEPPMNLVHFDEARSVGGALSLSGKDRSVALRGIEAGPSGGTVTLGFRHFSAALQPQAGENCLEGSVYVSEQIEDSRVYSLMVGDDLVKVLTPRDTRFDINQRVSIRLDPRAVYLFDGASGERIGAGA